MTIWQILALAICGPIALWNFVYFIGIILKRSRGSWDIWNAVAIVLSVVLIVVSFVGVRW